MADSASAALPGAASGAEAERQAFEERLDRIAALFTDIVVQAEASSRSRCPYRDRRDLCTALFRCRNQLSSGAEGRPACGHDGTFDYRSAWESHPRAAVRAREKIAAVKEEAEARRRTASNGQPESGKGAGP